VGFESVARRGGGETRAKEITFFSLSLSSTLFVIRFSYCLCFSVSVLYSLSLLRITDEIDGEFRQRGRERKRGRGRE